MKKIFSNAYVRYCLVALGGLLLGWIFFHSPHKMDVKKTKVVQAPKKIIWTCSMHPQIRMDHAGKCPICDMDLIQLVQNNSAVDSNAVHFTKESAELANVQTTIVTSQKPIREVRLYGKVQADERLLQNQVSHISGRIEKLYVNFTGEIVHKGQTLASVYSPELVTAQQELIEAAKSKQSQPEIYDAAKEKLRQWKLSESQIANIEKSGKIQNTIEITSTSTGIVTARRVNSGDYISQGSVLYDISDLSSVWVLFDAYESDLPTLIIGNNISFTVNALPNLNFSGKIKFIDPVIDPVNRVSKVRVEMSNKDGKLKPEMFATGIVKANLAKYANAIIIPRTAVLWTGKRSIVYIKEVADEPIFTMREIELGEMLGSSYVVVNGLKEGEEIVTQGTFSVDAAAQLDGKSSMMNSK
jgi:membrane fusion protein, copper/silver efflux system